MCDNIAYFISAFRNISNCSKARLHKFFNVSWKKFFRVVVWLEMILQYFQHSSTKILDSNLLPIYNRRSRKQPKLCYNLVRLLSAFWWKPGLFWGGPQLCFRECFCAGRASWELVCPKTCREDPSHPLSNIPATCPWAHSATEKLKCIIVSIGKQHVISVLQLSCLKSEKQIRSELLEHKYNLLDGAEGKTNVFENFNESFIFCGSCLFLKWPLPFVIHCKHYKHEKYNLHLTISTWALCLR